MRLMSSFVLSMFVLSTSTILCSSNTPQLRHGIMQGISSTSFDRGLNLESPKSRNLRARRQTMTTSSAEQATEELLHVLYNETGVDKDQIAEFFENWDTSSQQGESTSTNAISSAQQNGNDENNEETNTTVNTTTSTPTNQSLEVESSSNTSNEASEDDTKTPTSEPESRDRDGAKGGLPGKDSAPTTTDRKNSNRWSLQNFFRSDRWVEILIISAWLLFLVMFCGCACLVVAQRKRRQRQIDRDEQIQWREGAWVTVLGQGLAGTTIIGTDRYTKKIQILLAEALAPGKVTLKDYNFCVDTDDLEDQISFCHRSTPALEDCTSIDVSSLDAGVLDRNDSRSSGESDDPPLSPQNQQLDIGDDEVVEDMQTGAILRKYEIAKEPSPSSAGVGDDAQTAADKPNPKSAAKQEPMVIIPSIFALKRSHQVVQNECVICMDKLRPGQEVSVSPFILCKHVFHADCIFTWCLHQLKENQLQSATSDISQMRRGGRDFAQNSANCPCCRQTYVVIQKLGMRQNEH